MNLDASPFSVAVISNPLTPSISDSSSSDPIYKNKLSDLVLPTTMGHHTHHGTATDGVVNSPRFSAPMTRRAHSFKRGSNEGNNSSSAGVGGGLGTHHEIDLQMVSPRSENGVSPTSICGFEPIVDRKQGHGYFHHQFHNVRERRRPIIGSMAMDLGFKEKKKLGHLMFLTFCAACLFLGVLRICTTGWLGSVIESAESIKVSQLHRLHAALITPLVFLLNLNIIPLEHFNYLSKLLGRMRKSISQIIE